MQEFQAMCNDDPKLKAIKETSLSIEHYFLHGLEECAFGEMLVRAEAAIDLFEDDYAIVDNVRYGLSDGEYCDEYIADMARIEHRLMTIAANIRRVRLDAENHPSRRETTNWK